MVERALNRPSWASFAINLGNELATSPNAQVGELRPTVFLSVPTGQFLAPLMASGALLSPPKLADSHPRLGESFRAASFDGESQVCDLDVTVVAEDFMGSPNTLLYKSGGYKRTLDNPLIRLPAGVPEDRSTKVLTVADWQVISAEFGALKAKPAPSSKIWWASHCLSPVVIIGESLEYVDRQREELLRDVPQWFDEQSRPLIAFTKSGSYIADRLLHYPYSYLKIDADKSRPWLRVLRPRLVIYTSWRAYYRRIPSSFSGTPAVVIVNRRVHRADIEAAALTDHDPSASFRFLAQLPHGFGARVSFEVAEADDGRVYGQEDDEEWDAF